MKKRDSAVFVCLVFFVFFFIFQINLSSISRLNVNRSTRTQETKRWELQTTSKPDQITCDRSHSFYDVCSINGPTVLDPTTSTFFTMGPTQLEKIRPYTRKWENSTMSRIKELTLTSGPPPGPKCQVQHNSPALVFSAGGYTGNFFHEFNDGFIPLFITVNSISPPHQDFILVISEARDWWIRKYADVLHSISPHPIINLDNDTSTHCFPSATVGLISHGFMAINPNLIPTKKSLTHFRGFLENVYGQTQIHPRASKSKPRLVLISRNKGDGREILNQGELKKTAEDLGFEVTVFEPNPYTHLRESYNLINSSHAVVGVHGAALTHLLFMRRRAVVVQVVPLGARWVAEVCYGKPARDLGLEYMEYEIGVEESSLVEKYGREEMVVRDPVGFQGKNWSDDVMRIYLKEQNVRLEMVRFRDYLKKAYEKAKKFVDNEG